MLRNILLTAFAAATLAGCATDYAYRGGNGDYYYGQPRVEYRYYDFSKYDLSSATYFYLPSYSLGTFVNTIRVGLAYLFSAPAPVVAKY